MKLQLLSLVLGVAIVAATNPADSCNCINGECTGCERVIIEEGLVEKREAQCCGSWDSMRTAIDDIIEKREARPPPGMESVILEANRGVNVESRIDAESSIEKREAPRRCTLICQAHDCFYMPRGCVPTEKREVVEEIEEETVEKREASGCVCVRSPCECTPGNGGIREAVDRARRISLN